MKKLTLLLALMVATGTFKAYAQVVVYNFNAPCNNTGCATDTCHGRGNALPSSINVGVIASASAFNASLPSLSINGGSCGSGGNMNGFSSGYTSNPNRSRWASNWPTGSIAVNPNSDYFTFTLTTNPLYLVQIDEIRWLELRSPSDGPTGRQLRTSDDTYVTVFVPSSTAALSSWFTRRVTTGLPDFNGSIEIRIYGNNAVSSNGTLRIDNVQVYAHVLIDNLPIELLSFTGEKVDESKVRLLWSTASERDNDYFTVFRCNDLVTWQEVGTVPGAGSSQSRTDYTLVDAFPLIGTNYYKLRQTDFDGTFVDSDIIAVDFDVGDTFVTFPNPSARGQPIRASKKVDFILDGLGKLVRFDPTNIIIETAGVYTLVHIDEKGFSATCRLIVTN